MPRAQGRAPGTTCPVQSAAKTKQFNDFNDGHVVDIAEIGAGDSGEDVVCVCKGADQNIAKRECSAAGSALTLLRPPPSAVHGHSVRACTSSVGQRLPVDARAECLHSFGAVEQ